MQHVHLARTFHYKGMNFWAEGGLIHMEDKNNGEYSVVTRKDCLLRAKAINDTIQYYPHASERDEQHRLVQDLIECVRQAKDQGDPTDPEIFKQKLKEIKRSSSILLPGGAVPGIIDPRNKPI